MLPAVDAALHRAVETSLTAAWRGAVRLGRDDGDGIEGKPYVRRLHVESAPADTPPSVVVKRPRLADGETFDARSERPETTKFFTECAWAQDARRSITSSAYGNSDGGIIKPMAS